MTRGKLNTIGIPRRRVDGRAKVTGQTRFADDVALPRTVYCKLLRSKMPHARIAGVDVTAAERHPGVLLVLTGRDFPIIVIQEAGLDGFWIHRVLQSEGIESHVVDAASILTSRRRRRAKTDRIDGETLVRTLMAFKRGELFAAAHIPSST